MAKANLRKSEATKPAASPIKVMNPQDEVRWPVIASHLTQTRWDDDTTRVTSTLLFFCEDGAMKVCLHDREAGMVCFITGEGLTGTLDALEAALSDETAVWRKKRQLS